MPELMLQGGRVVTPEGVVEADVHVRDGIVEAVGGTPRGRRVEVVALDGRWALPGFVDVHVHGGGGADATNGDPEELRALARFHARHGTAALLATTVPAPPERLLAALDAIRAVAAAAPDEEGAVVLGAHLEGPFLNPRRAGALATEHLLDPDPALAARLLAGGGVRIVSLAPELPGAAALVRQVVAAGAVASLAHSDATYEDAEACVMAGARAATHAFNAMRPLHQREPGVLGAALADDRVTCEAICDGVHVHPALVRLLHRAKGAGRAMLVTDAISATGMADGAHRLGDREIHVAAGRATLPDGKTLAGSTLTMDRALRIAVEHCGIPLPDAARMAATTPAQLLGIADRMGVLAPGRRADIVVLEPDLTLAGVLLGGRWVRRTAAFGG
jgi:N-acetylglucosamine-6-phosphate deacetylase